jgi:hypothetical protein
MKEPNRTAVLRNETLPPPYDRLRSLARPLGQAALGSWLSVHSEPGQSLREYEQQSPPPGMDGAIVLTHMGNEDAGLAEDAAFEQSVQAALLAKDN